MCATPVARRSKTIPRIARPLALPRRTPTSSAQARQPEMNRGPPRLLIVGNADPVHLGAHLLHAARSIGVNVTLADTRAAFEAPIWRRRFNWWLRGHRPSALGPFGEQVVQTVRDEGIDC